MPTIGVAIAVPQPYAGELRDQRASFGDERALSVPMHITLVPPTPVDADGLGDVERHLSSVAGRHGRFEVRLRGTGTFRPVSSVVFVAVAAGISDCEMLAGDVRTGPLAMRLEFPYHPHVTVAHDVDDDSLDRAFDALAAYQCDFGVDDFGLYAHDEQAGWRRRRDFSLRGAAHR